MNTKKLGKKPTQKGSASFPSGSNFPGGEVIQEHSLVETNPNREKAIGKPMEKSFALGGGALNGGEPVILNVVLIWPPVVYSLGRENSIEDSHPTPVVSPCPRDFVLAPNLGRV